MGLNRGIAFKNWNISYFSSISSFWCVLTSLVSASRAEILQTMMLLTTHLLSFHIFQIALKNVEETSLSMCEIKDDEHLVISILNQEFEHDDYGTNPSSNIVHDDCDNCSNALAFKTDHSVAHLDHDCGGEPDGDTCVNDESDESDEYVDTEVNPLRDFSSLQLPCDGNNSNF